MKLKISETEIVKSIMEYLRLKGHLCRRSNTGLTTGYSTKGKKWAIHMGESGWPDIDVICKDGKYAGIEVKSRIGKPTEDQIRVGKDIQARNGIWFIARSVEDVIQKGF